MANSKTSSASRQKSGRGSSKSGSRPPVRRQGRNVPVLPVVIGVVFLVIFIGLFVAYRAVSGGSGGVSTGARTIANIECNPNEQLVTHYHAHLMIIYKGQPVPVPAGVGFGDGGNCLYWIHTHDATGVVHVEAPKSAADRVFTLGDFFAIWGQPLSSTQVATLTTAAGDEVRIWVDGQPYTGNPKAIPLRSHTDVVIQIGPPFEDPPPRFSWPSNLPA